MNLAPGGMIPESRKEEEDPFSSALGPPKQTESSMLAIEHTPNNVGQNTSQVHNNQFNSPKISDGNSFSGMGNDTNVSRGSNNSMGGMGMNQPMGGMKTMQPPNSNPASNQATKMMEHTIQEQERMVKSRQDDISMMNSTYNTNSQLLSSLKEKSDKLRKELDRLNNEYK